MREKDLVFLLSLIYNVQKERRRRCIYSVFFHDSVLSYSFLSEICESIRLIACIEMTTTSWLTMTLKFSSTQFHEENNIFYRILIRHSVIQMLSDECPLQRVENRIHISTSINRVCIRFSVSAMSEKLLILIILNCIWTI